MNGDTLIIIIIFSSLSLLFILSILFRFYRYFSSTSNPLPPVQPLAHHRLSYHRNKSALDDDDDDYVLVDPFRHGTPTLSRPRPISVASNSRLSTASPSLTLSSGRRGLPHSPHSQINIVLPAPLSASPSSSSIVAADELGHLLPTQRVNRNSTRPNSRHFLDVSSEYDRRSMTFVDRWLPTPSPDSYSLSSSHSTTDPPTQPRIPSPLIPHSPSSSSLVKPHPQNPKLFPSTLHNPLPNPDNSYSNIHLSSNQPESLPLIPAPESVQVIPTVITSTTDDHIPIIPNTLPV